MPIFKRSQSLSTNGDVSDAGCSTPSTPQRRGSAASRAQSVAALVLKGSQVLHVPALKVVVGGCVDARVQVTLQGAKAEGRGLPDVCPAGKTSTATFVSTAVCRSPSTKGTLVIDGFDPLPFCIVSSDQGGSWVSSKGRWRVTVLSAPQWDWRDKGEKPSEGKAADVEVVGSRYSDRAPQLKVQLRVATEAELKRCLQLQALKEAKEGEDYDTLHAQVAKAKMAGVEMEHIERAEERLRELRRRGLHVHDGCDKETLKELMVWSKVTRWLDRPSENEPCAASATCPCNEQENCGEVLTIVPAAVQACLREFGPEGDRELFEELAGAALAVEEGSVWRAGGKFIFSAFDRNQSVTALTRMLNNYGRARCAKMILQLVKTCEQLYSGYVTAIQVNFHPHANTFHSQHRDIYSAKQRAGPNCTCSFRKCVGTVCYTVGSSRVCLLETMTDEMSSIRPCSDRCTGRKERRWLHSGDAMYFNEAWNNNHTHGIPPMAGDDALACGPRISVAFLLGAEEFRNTLFQEPQLTAQTVGSNSAGSPMLTP